MKPSIPKGTRDFSPVEMARRNFILRTIQSVYEKYGFRQIETPAMENLSTLEGKYGEEGDKLLFRILNSGDAIKEFRLHCQEELKAFQDIIDDIIGDKNFNLDSIAESGIQILNEKEDVYLRRGIQILENVLIIKSALEDLEYSKHEFSSLNEVKSFFNDYYLNELRVFDVKRDIFKRNYNRSLSEKGLRYDLTVPFARYVVMHRNEITFPFRRYQMQPVWRADRPQKGRYREFYQCDADVIGSSSLLNEVELVQIIQEVFSKLNIGVTIKINNRKILSGIAEVIGEADKIIDITVAIDKLDKIGAEKVNEELKTKGVSEQAIKKIQPLFSFSGTTADKLSFLKNFLSESAIGKKGIEEIEAMYEYFNASSMSTENVELDITLARGLNYYTGAIFEVKVNDARSTFASSVLGGGRYDDLTGIFGLPDVSGVGISFGIDRIYDVMLEMKLFEQLQVSMNATKVMVVNFGKEEEKHALKMISQLRAAGTNAELYPDAGAKMKKQMSYADAYQIPFVLLVGDEEIKSGKYALKNMQSGEQVKMEMEEIIKFLNKQ